MQNTKQRLLSIKNLKKYFAVGKASALNRHSLYVRANEDISIDIFQGETLGLVGESGCGKSTFGRVLLQLYPQTAGSTMYYGRTLSEMAPQYVGKTLKNAAKMVEKYHEAQKKADEAVKKCEEIGDSVSYEQNNEKDELVFAAENALNNIAKVIGGFMVSKDIDEASKLLLEKYEADVEVAKLRSLISQTRLSKAAAEEAGKNTSKLDNKISDAETKVKEFSAKSEESASKINALKEKNKDVEDFAKYEAMLDDGVDLSRLTYNEIRCLRKDLQIIFQDPYSSLNPRMTVGQIIEEGLVTHGMFRPGAEETKKYILELMRKCGLQDYMLHRYPHQFSGGQRQRICIARALAVNPKFVVCDECVSALDVSIQSQIINLLQDLKRDSNLTYLFISHDLSVVKYISDRIGVMYLGNMVELADKEAIFKDPRHPYTVALLSSIPTTDPDSANKERIILEGNIPSPIKPPTGCKFHTRCFMATEKCARIAPKLTEVEPNHFVACHYPECKLGQNGEWLFKVNKSGELAADNSKEA